MEKNTCETKSTLHRYTTLAVWHSESSCLATRSSDARRFFSSMVVWSFCSAAWQIYNSHSFCKATILYYQTYRFYFENKLVTQYILNEAYHHHHQDQTHTMSLSKFLTSTHCTATFKHLLKSHLFKCIFQLQFVSIFHCILCCWLPYCQVGSAPRRADTN